MTRCRHPRGERIARSRRLVRSGSAAHPVGPPASATRPSSPAACHLRISSPGPPFFSAPNTLFHEPPLSTRARAFETSTRLSGVAGGVQPAPPAPVPVPVPLAGLFDPDPELGPNHFPTPSDRSRRSSLLLLSSHVTSVAAGVTRACSCWRPKSEAARIVAGAAWGEAGAGVAGEAGALSARDARKAFPALQLRMKAW